MRRPVEGMDEDGFKARVSGKSAKPHGNFVNASQSLQSSVRRAASWPSALGRPVSAPRLLRVSVVSVARLQIDPRSRARLVHQLRSSVVSATSWPSESDSPVNEPQSLDRKEKASNLRKGMC